MQNTKYLLQICISSVFHFEKKKACSYEENQRFQYMKTTLTIHRSVTENLVNGNALPTSSIICSYRPMYTEHPLLLNECPHHRHRPKECHQIIKSTIEISQSSRPSIPPFINRSSRQNRLQRQIPRRAPDKCGLGIVAHHPILTYRIPVAEIPPG